MGLISSLIFAVLLGALTGNAAPLIQKRGIGADLLARFKLMEQYASAAYCANNYNSPGDQVECASGNCPLVQDADSATVAEYSREETATDVTGFVAVDHTNKLIIVSFRGSTSIDAWRTNFEFDTTATDICSGCTAHHGFWNSWLDARDRVIPAVKQASTTFPSYQITVTGHSLGAAIATLGAAQLRNSGYTAALYTFGSPRIGGTKISSYISNQSGGNYRVTHWNDPVPKLPLLTMGYVHTSPEYYINKPNKKDVLSGDIQIYEGAINLRGNTAWLLIDIEAHRWYFGSVYTCDAKKGKRGGLEIRGVEGGVDIVATF
ncbi:alpha/beta-hydrolase [Cucurbitaria berberidis CBS 394.84]|uniref:Alpha/beta-hydrolase n=1 Tax=Cucurbitaria berberidis CBS 394.84 TaxID=1168544 RepID=A0A9P4GBV1_9PLEO|nr:alpha/beta-hydrolase [Cucurbitaria berberidis CBS 394.84]KAF1842365.1 alpha/beta-hydrolase [Cucurbitaria berberidis CBS 394.84]